MLIIIKIFKELRVLSDISLFIHRDDSNMKLFCTDYEDVSGNDNHGAFKSGYI